MPQEVECLVSKGSIAKKACLNARRCRGCTELCIRKGRMYRILGDDIGASFEGDKVFRSSAAAEQ